MANRSGIQAPQTAIFYITVAAILITAAVLPSYAAQPPNRVGPEVKIGGLTVEERNARQLQLHGELTTRLPAGVNRSPLRVEITEADKNNMLNQAPRGTAPLRIGIVKSLSNAAGKPFGRAFNYGVIETNADGSFVWAMTVTSPGAQALRLHITGFSLPDNTEMYFISPNGQAHGAYTGTGRNGDGDFWTHSIASETGQLVLLYTGNMPERDRPLMSFAISEVAHIGGRSPRAQEQSHDDWPCSDNASCLVDVNCQDTGPAAPAENAVAKMEWISGPWINTCTGGLLADTDPITEIPYFLTANHCLSSDNSSLETFFNYRTDSCNGSCPDGLVAGGTPPSADTIGATVAATGSAGDFTLLILNQDPPAEDTTFLGWNNSDVANIDGTSLYRISNANFGPQVYSEHIVDKFSSTCSGWPRGERIYSTDLAGATMGGSSGSPVLNSEGEVVGQLSGCCGFDCADECDSANNWTVDGALAFYWDDVAEFLDPQPECSNNSDCDDGLFCTGTESCQGGLCQSDGDPCSNGTLCNEDTDSCDIPVCDNDGFCEAGEDCSNCPNDCRAKTNGNPRSRYCCDGDLPDCGDPRCSENGWCCGGESGSCSVDSDCDDGSFCNGDEICNSGTCQNGVDPCPGIGCDEGSDVCVECGGGRWG